MKSHGVAFEFTAPLISKTGKGEFLRFQLSVDVKIGPKPMVGREVVIVQDKDQLKRLRDAIDASLAAEEGQ